MLPLLNLKNNIEIVVEIVVVVGRVGVWESAIFKIFMGVLLFAGFYLTLVGRLLQVAIIAILLVLLLRRDVHGWLKKKEPPPSLPHPLTKKEAAALLKVKQKATAEEIQKAFEGAKPKDSTELDRLEQARDLLLGRRR